MDCGWRQLTDSHPQQGPDRFRSLTGWLRRAFEAIPNHAEQNPIPVVLGNEAKATVGQHDDECIWGS